MSTATLINVDVAQELAHLAELLAHIQSNLDVATATLQKVAEINSIPLSQQD